MTLSLIFPLKLLFWSGSDAYMGLTLGFMRQTGGRCFAFQISCRRCVTLICLHAYSNRRTKYASQISTAITCSRPSLTSPAMKVADEEDGGAGVKEGRWPVSLSSAEEALLLNLDDTLNTPSPGRPYVGKTVKVQM